MCINLDPNPVSERLQFNNRFVDQLPGDPQTDPFPRQVYGACYSKIKPTAVTKPQTMVYSREVMELLGLEARFAESRAFFLNTAAIGQHKLSGG